MSVHRQIPHTLVLEHVSPATRLLEKRRQMFEVQEALEQQKQDYARKVAGLVTSWRSRSIPFILPATWSSCSLRAPALQVQLSAE